MRKRILSILIIILIFLFIIRIDLPEGLKLQVKIGKWNLDHTITPFTVDTTLFGKRIKKEFRLMRGLDLQGGSHMVFEADVSKLSSSDKKDAVASARDIIEKRVNFFGVSEPLVYTLKSGDSSQIVVDLPGSHDSGTLLALIGQTAKLSFKEEALTNAQTKEATPEPLLSRLTEDTGLSGAHIKKAQVQFDTQSGAPTVLLRFTDEGARLFEEVTKRNIGKQVGIFIDDLPLSAPVVQQVISGGEAVISGDFTVEAAKSLTISINSGALPVTLQLKEIKQIGPTLGAREIRDSLIAGGVGLLMVVVFMIIYYRALGVIASSALLIYGLLSLAIIKSFGVVLTLSGVAGFILSIGMAVDANILIFERMKEEQRRGKSFDIAFRIGFGKAISAIKNANITTLLVAFILFNPLNWSFFPQFGLVKGFALTLAIGVLTSLFTGVVITKRMIALMYKNK